jgi:hypothetical protein
MSEEKHDPREKDVSDQLPEEQQEEAVEGRSSGSDGDAPRTPTDGDPQQATGNRRAAG